MPRIPRGARLCERCAAPAVRRVHVQLVLVHEEPATLEQVDPVLRRPLDLPALVVELAGRHADEDAAVLPDHTPQLAQRGLVAALVACAVDRVDAVVPPDVLERRDAEDELERRVLEGELADVGEDRSQPGHLGLGEVDADELLGAECREPGEVGRLGERVADVEHALLAVVAREAPGNLDDPLVARRGRA